MTRSNKSKVFTEEEFKMRVQFWWGIMILSEFPTQKCYDILFINTDKFNSYCHMYNKEIHFGRGLLTGKYKLWFVDAIIKHEIAHALDFMRNGFATRLKKTKRGWVYDMHGKHFKAIAKEFDFIPYSSVSDKRMKDLGAYAN